MSIPTDARWPEWTGAVEAHTKYDGWKPYCLVCETMERMRETRFGYRCVSCYNEITPDMKHYNPEPVITVEDGMNRSFLGAGLGAAMALSSLSNIGGRNAMPQRSKVILTEAQKASVDAVKAERARANDAKRKRKAERQAKGMTASHNKS